MMMQDWNVVITVFQGGFKRAVRALQELGRIERSPYHRVLVMAVENPVLTRFHVSRLPRAVSILRRRRSSANERRRSHSNRLPRLANQAFHVRVHGRGFGRYLHTQDAERIIDDMLLTALEKEGVSFVDPDAVIAIDSVDHRAGMALWTRDDLKRHPLLRPD